MSKVRRYYNPYPIDLKSYGVIVHDEYEFEMVQQYGIHTSCSNDSEINLWIMRYNRCLAYRKLDFDMVERYPQYIEQYGVDVHSVGEKAILIKYGERLWNSSSSLEKEKRIERNNELLRTNANLAKVLNTTPYHKTLKSELHIALGVASIFGSWFITRLFL